MSTPAGELAEPRGGMLACRAEATRRRPVQARFRANARRGKNPGPIRPAALGRFAAAGPIGRHSSMRDVRADRECRCLCRSAAPLGLNNSRSAAIGPRNHILAVKERTARLPRREPCGLRHSRHQVPSFGTMPIKLELSVMPCEVAMLPICSPIDLRSVASASAKRSHSGSRESHRKVPRSDCST